MNSDRRQFMPAELRDAGHPPGSDGARSWANQRSQVGQVEIPREAGPKELTRCRAILRLPLEHHSKVSYPRREGARAAK